MFEDRMRSAVTRRRLLSGPVGGHVAAFADWLHAGGYTAGMVEFILRSLAAWADWMAGEGFDIREAVAAVDACKAWMAKVRRPPFARGPNRPALSAARCFVRYLQQTGVIASPHAPKTAVDTWPLLREFRTWMRAHRGVTESTLDVYEPIVVDLVRMMGDDPATYSASALRSFVHERARLHSLWRAKTITIAVRAYVRFLGATGRTSVGLEHALLSYRSPHLAAVPRYLEPSELQRVIDACLPDSSRGRRDRAVILLLSRLGLRAGEVARLEFPDVDWKDGRIAVCGKSRRPEWLPLPHEVGEAVLEWLQAGRPRLRSSRIFTTILAPHRPLSRASVTHVARAAFRRAGIEAAVNGAHALRHSAATSMLRQGASLAGIGAVLRHKAPSTTMLYAKVDFDLLSEIAQPWPEVTSC